MRNQLTRKRLLRKRLGIAAAFAVAIIGGGAAGLWLLGPHLVDNMPPQAPPRQGSMQLFTPFDAPPPAPRESFTDAEGRQIRLSDFAGRVALVNFWATWCGPCVREMPSLDRLQKTLGGADFVVLALSQDRGGTKPVASFYRKHGLESLAIHIDARGKLARAFGVTGIPATFLIGRDGKVVGRLDGPAEWDSREAIALVRFYLGRRPERSP